MDNQYNKQLKLNNGKSLYSLQGSQPYVLTGNWTRGFTPNLTEYVPDLSMMNVVPSNDVPNLHPVHFPMRIVTKDNMTMRNIMYPYEGKSLDEC